MKQIMFATQGCRVEICPWFPPRTDPWNVVNSIYKFGGEGRVVGPGTDTIHYQMVYCENKVRRQE